MIERIGALPNQMAYHPAPPYHQADLQELRLLTFVDSRPQAIVHEHCQHLSYSNSLRTFKGWLRLVLFQVLYSGYFRLHDNLCEVASEELIGYTRGKYFVCCTVSKQ